MGTSRLRFQVLAQELQDLRPRLDARLGVTLRRATRVQILGPGDRGWRERWRDDVSGFGKVEMLVARPSRLRAPTHECANHLGCRPHLVVAAAHEKDRGLDSLNTDLGILHG